MPKSSQDTIPYLRVCDDKIFELEKGYYSCTYEFTDINYRIARQEAQNEIFKSYCDILNSFDTVFDVQVSIINTKVDKENFEERVLIQEQDDEYSHLRKEYNKMLLDKISEGQNDLEQQRYITLSVKADNYKMASNQFLTIESDLVANFKKIGSVLVEKHSQEKLEILKNIFRGADVDIPKFDKLDYIKKHERNYITPSDFEFKNDYFMYEDKYARCLFVRDFPPTLQDTLVTKFTETGVTMILSVNIQPIASEEAVKIVRRKLTSIHTNKLQNQKKSIQNGFGLDIMPYEMQHSLEEAEELLNDLVSKNQKMFLTNFVIMHINSTYEGLNNDTEQIKNVARKHLCNVANLKYQQEDGMSSVLPIGNNKLKIRRTLTTESTSILMPFSTQEIVQKQGMYVGVNAVSKNLILFNKEALQNYNGFILGASGSGKSFSVKRELINVLLACNDDVVIIDPEGEYINLVKEFGGEVIHISAGSPNYINVLELSKNYSDEEDPLLLKSEFILSLCELLIGGKNGLTAVQKGIIDRCLSLTYIEYVQDFDKENTPTLKDFHKILTEQPEREAKELALSLEIYTKGNLSIFSNKSNVNLNKRLTVFVTKDLGNQLKTMGMLIVLDNIWNRITENKKKGKMTRVYLDEIYLMFKNEYSSNFLHELYKRSRKWGGMITGITQNIDDLLKNELACSMLANSEYIMMLNQAPTDRIKLAKLLEISDTQLSYITNAERGSGLLRCGENIIPFIDKFPKNTRLYQMMQTNPKKEEGVSIEKNT